MHITEPVSARQAASFFGKTLNATYRYAASHALARSKARVGGRLVVVFDMAEVQKHAALVAASPAGRVPRSVPGPGRRVCRSKKAVLAIVGALPVRQALVMERGAEATGLEPNAIQYAIRELVAAGEIRRLVVPGERRASAVYLVGRESPVTAAPQDVSRRRHR